MRERYYNPHSDYNRIALSEETQEYIRILRYIPENTLICADSITPYIGWRTPEDYFAGKKPVPVLKADNDIECRKLFSEVDFTDIKKHSFEHYIRYSDRAHINLPLYLYDLYNSEAFFDVGDNEIIFQFNGVYNKNNNFDIIQNHIYIPSLKVSFGNTSSMSCKLRSCSETVKVGISSIDAKTTIIDVSDKAKLAEFLSGIKHIEPYYLRDHDNVIYSEFILSGNDKLVLEFRYREIRIEETDYL